MFKDDLLSPPAVSTNGVAVIAICGRALGSDKRKESKPELANSGLREAAGSLTIRGAYGLL